MYNHHCEEGNLLIYKKVDGLEDRAISRRNGCLSRSIRPSHHAMHTFQIVCAFSPNFAPGRDHKTIRHAWPNQHECLNFSSFTPSPPGRNDIALSTDTRSSICIQSFYFRSQVVHAYMFRSWITVPLSVWCHHHTSFQSSSLELTKLFSHHYIVDDWFADDLIDLV